jgi:glucokinase
VSPLIVGLDLGGTKLAGGLVDISAGTIVRRVERPTNSRRGGDAVLADCVALASEVAADKAAGIGIGVPELVSRTGQVTSAASWDWRGLDLAAAFAGIGPVHLESDVRAAALAEARLGAGRDLSSFLYLTIGTGVSHTLVIGGTPWPGARGNAIVVGAPLVEAYAGGAALAARAGRARAQEVVGAPAHQPLVDDVMQTLGTELARLVNALDPQAVVIGGGLGLAADALPRIAAVARERIYAADTRELPIIGARLGRDAGIIGAALAFTSAQRP